MPKAERVLEVGGWRLVVPPYINRTVSGWQVRVRELPSQHFADAHYGDAKASLEAAAGAAVALQAERARWRGK